MHQCSIIVAYGCLAVAVSSTSLQASDLASWNIKGGLGESVDQAVPLPRTSYG